MSNFTSNNGNATLSEDMDNFKFIFVIPTDGSSNKFYSTEMIPVPVLKNITANDYIGITGNMGGGVFVAQIYYVSNTQIHVSCPCKIYGVL